MLGTVEFGTFFGMSSSSAYGPECGGAKALPCFAITVGVLVTLFALRRWATNE